MLNRRYYYVLFFSLAILYIALSLLAPLSSNRFNLSTAETRVLQLTIYLPIVLIWTVAAYGAEKFKSYSYKIRKEADGVGLNKIANGLIALLAFQVLNGLFGVLRPWALTDNWLTVYTITANLIAAFGPIVAYTCMYAGSVDLLKLIKNKRLKYVPLIVMSFLILVGAVFVKLLIDYQYGSSTPDPNKYSSFYESDPMVILTFGLPYLIGWGLGLMAAVNINFYQRHIKGTIYRKALSRLVLGILTVILLYIAVELLVSVSTFIASAGLASILVFLYGLILIYGIGFLLIASGAKKMGKI
jgi:hypothetical protein